MARTRTGAAAAEQAPLESQAREVLAESPDPASLKPAAQSADLPGPLTAAGAQELRRKARQQVMAWPKCEGTTRPIPAATFGEWVDQTIAWLPEPLSAKGAALIWIVDALPRGREAIAAVIGELGPLDRARDEAVSQALGDLRADIAEVARALVAARQEWAKPRRAAAAAANARVRAAEHQTELRRAAGTGPADARVGSRR